MSIGGTSAGAQTGGYGQLSVLGSVSLSDDTGLVLSAIDGYSPSPHDEFVLIDNDGVDAVDGAFSGLTEGSEIADFLGSGLVAQITYVGGDGNDVVVKVLAPEVELSVSSGTASESDETQITITATASAAVQGAQTVSVSISGDGVTSGDYSLSATSITIADGQTAGTVTLTIADDALIEDAETLTVELESPSDGLRLGQTIEQDVVISIDDVAGMTLSESSLLLSETSSSQTVSVVLNAEPTSAVEIAISVNDQTEASVDVSRLTFAPGNWDVPQAVTVSGVDDSVADGVEVSQLSVAIDTEISDVDFMGVDSQTVDLATQDDESASFTVTESAGRTRVLENGPADSLLVVLDSEPLDDVVITVANEDEDEVMIDTTRLTFTPANWDQQQLVSVVAGDDADIDGSTTTTIELRVDIASSHEAFHQAPGIDVDVVAIDDDGPVYVSGDTLNVIGTDEADYIRIEQSVDEVQVTLNDASFEFLTSEFDLVSVVGGSGNDIVAAASLTTPLSFNGGAGDDSILSGSGNDTLRGGGGNDTLRGADGDDFLNGGSGADSLRGEAGSDAIEGSNGPDKVLGGTENDTLNGGEGADTINAGSGDDSANAGSGEDSIVGGNGNDTIGGGSGKDTIDGGSGDDVVQGGNGADEISGGEGADLILGQNGADTITGDDDRDVLIGGKGKDDISGGTRNDLLVAGYTTLDIASLKTVVDEWNSARNYADRIANVTGESDSERLNTAFIKGSDSVDGQTVFDDGHEDKLFGENASDLFFASVGLGDILQDQLSQETVLEI